MCSVHVGPKIVFVPLYLTLFFVSPHFEDIMLFIHFVLENTLLIVTTWSSGQHVKIDAVSIIKMADIEQKFASSF